MSEYQYYEFLALDRPLTDAEYEHVRGLSTGAEITRTRFVNEYQWGDFRGDPVALMGLCYDAHLYFANWGTQTLMLRLPLSWPDLSTADEYCNDETLRAHRSGENIVLQFHSQDESGEDWGFEHPALASLIGVRAELARGDLRPLYLAWLAGAYYLEDEYERDPAYDDAVEPPVPAGLAHLTAAQRALADFLRVDQDLLKVAAEASEKIVTGTAADGDRDRDRDAAMESWISGLTTKQKGEIIRHLLSDDHALRRAEILQTLQPRAPKPSTVQRSVSSLLTGATNLADLRKLEQQRELERQRELREQEAQRHRESRLAMLSDRGERPWADIADLIAAKKPSSYDAAVQLLTDLAEISRRRGRTTQFAEQLAELRSTHHRKPNLIERLDAADLP
jgi:hypothetical protein